MAILNDLQHIPHQLSSTPLAYHIEDDQLVSYNSRLVHVHVAMVRRCNLFNCLPHPSDNHIEVRSKVHVYNSLPVKLQPVMQ